MEKIKGEASWKVSEYDEFTIDEDFLKELETVNVEEQIPILKQKSKEVKTPKRKKPRVTKKTSKNKTAKTNKKAKTTKKKSEKKTPKKKPAKKKVVKKKTSKKKAVNKNKKKKVKKKVTTKKKDDKMVKKTPVKKSTVNKNKKIVKTTKKKATKKKTAKKSTVKKKAVNKKTTKISKPKGEPKRKPIIRKNKKKQSKKWLKPTLFIVGLIIILILLGFLFAWLNKVRVMNEQEKLFADYNPNKSITIATINDYDLTLDDFNKQVNMLPADKKIGASRNNVLEWIIEEELLVQRAEKLGISVQEKDVETAYQELISNSGLTEEELLNRVANFNLNKESLLKLLKRQAIVNEVFVKEINKGIEISDEEAKAFYDNNSDLFKGSPQVSVEHLLIKNNTRSDEEAKTIIQDLAAKAMKGEDFCKLISENSEDEGSKNDCGKYTFGKGVMVPEFEEAAFDMKNGEYRIVKSSFGYHLIYKVSSTVSNNTNFEDVKDKIKATLLNDARLTAYKQYIANLKDESNIQIYLPQIMKSFGIDADAPIMTQEEYQAYVDEQQKIAEENAKYGQ